MGSMPLQVVGEETRRTITLSCPCSFSTTQTSYLLVTSTPPPGRRMKGCQSEATPSNFHVDLISKRNSHDE